MTAADVLEPIGCLACCVVALLVVFVVAFLASELRRRRALVAEQRALWERQVRESRGANEVDAALETLRKWAPWSRCE